MKVLLLSVNEMSDQILVCVRVHTPEWVELRLQWQNTAGHGASLRQRVCEPRPLLHVFN